MQRGFHCEIRLNTKNPGGHVGVSGIEEQITNVCGIAPEWTLLRYGFDFDEIVRRAPPLADRLGPLRRRVRWTVVGPILFSSRGEMTLYGKAPAGDTLGFVDPFTGSGILNAMLTGQMAGIAAGRGISAIQHGRPQQQRDVAHAGFGQLSYRFQVSLQRFEIPRHHRS